MKIWKYSSVPRLVVGLFFTSVLGSTYYITYSNSTRYQERETSSSLYQQSFPPQRNVSCLNKGNVAGGYYLKDCNCYKHETRFGHTDGRLLSTCSQEADWYGGEQKVISYVLHRNFTKEFGNGSFQEHFGGIVPNIHQARELYPGWIIRFYTDEDLDPTYCQYACMDEVMWCDVRDLTFTDMRKVNFRVWRFLVLGDPTVKTFVSRDLDSLITVRELEAVTEWETSNKGFHAMREYVEDSKLRPMFAGMWGAKNDLLGHNLTLALRQEIIKNGTNNEIRIYDEVILEEIIYKQFRFDQLLAHDSYFCNRYPNSVPFPKQRKTRFTRAALPISESFNFQALPCPLECRPSYGKDWEFC